MGSGIFGFEHMRVRISASRRSVNRQDRLSFKYCLNALRDVLTFVSQLPIPAVFSGHCEMNVQAGQWFLFSTKEKDCMRVVYRSTVVAALMVNLWFPSIASGQYVRFLPQDPRIGDVITVTYNSQARDAAIQRPEELILRTLILRDAGAPPILIETQMKNSGRLWKGTFTIAQADARYLLHQFVAGDLKDDNAGQGWGSIVTGADGKALKASHYWRAALLAFGDYMGFKFQKDPAAAKTEVALERKLFPEDYSAANLAWYLEMNPTPTSAGTTRIRKELDQSLRLLRKTEDALPTLLVWFDQIGEKRRADSLRKIFIAENPKGKVASSNRLSGLSIEHDPAKKIKILEGHLADFPLKEEEAISDKKQLVGLYVQIGEFEKAHTVLSSISKRDQALYKTLGAAMTAKGTGLDKAVTFVTEGIDIVRKQDESSKPPSSALGEWKRAQTNLLASLLQIRGQALAKSGRKDAAQADFEEAYKLSKGSDLSMNLNLIESCVANNKFQQAVDVGFACIREGKSNLSIVEQFKAAYKKVHGSMAGYDKAVQQSKSAQQSGMYKSALHKTAPEFSLRSLRGGPVKLSDLRGKVVVLGFWVTWSSLGNDELIQLQKSFESYEYYRTVDFVLVNASEKTTSPERDSVVSKTLKRLKCTIPVVFDEDPYLADKFAIEGVPTVYVIDKTGMLQFKHVGFSDGKALVDDLSKEIEVLLKH